MHVHVSGAFPRRSQHITGNRRNTDTESEDEDILPGAGAVGSKKTYAVAISTPLPPVRHQFDRVPDIGQRKCPIAGCDSFGHLGTCTINLVPYSRSSIFLYSWCAAKNWRQLPKLTINTPRLLLNKNGIFVLSA